MSGNYLGKGKAVESIPGRGAAPWGLWQEGSAAHEDLRPVWWNTEAERSEGHE